MTLRVYDLAHGRTGDKGNTSNVSVICYDAADWNFLRDVLTPERVMQAYSTSPKALSAATRFRS